MLDAIHKTFLAGVGLAVMTKDKVDACVKELVEKGKLSEKEGRTLASAMLKRSKQVETDLHNQVTKWVEQALHKLQVPTKQELDRLAARIEKLEARNQE